MAVSRRWWRFLALLAVFLMVLSTGVYLLTTPRPTDSFFQFYVLGNNGTEGDYFAHNNTMVVNQVENWTLTVGNRFTSSQLVGVVVKLGDSGTILPNGALGAPSNGTEVASYYQVLDTNQNWTLPFAWTITSLTSQGGTDSIGISIDGRAYTTTLPVPPQGGPLKLIFELWSLSPSSNQMGFGWTSNGKTEGAWLQIYFNMTRRA
ncbi:MAG: hypothetical protein JRN57_03750 [Nitrososphaerota archaeon]|nr:hypothetical protein [Nitrososphaerota archaeon]